MDRTRVVLIFRQDHDFFGSLDEFKRPAIQEKTGQGTARVIFDIPQRGWRVGIHEEVSPLFVFFRLPRQDFIRRIHQAEAPRLGGRRANQDDTTPSALREILSRSLKPWLWIIRELAILVILQRIFL